MKSIRSKSIDIEFIVDSICNCFRSKYNRNDVCKFIAQYSDGVLDKETVKLYAHNNDNFQLFIVPCFYNMAKEYYDEIINHNITFEPIATKERVDKSSNKVRLISTESIKQQIFDYICVDMMHDIFRRHLGAYQCASLPDRGQIYALEAIRNWIYNDRKGTKYFLKTDISDYFHSVNRDKVLDMVWDYTRNEQLLYIVNTILNTYTRGLSIGSYLSQYLANLFLSDVYHDLSQNYTYTKRGKVYNRVSHMMIYMDDILIFTRNKKNAQYILKELEEMAKAKDLTIHNTSIVKFDNDTYIDALGYKIYRTYTTLRKRNYKKIKFMTIEFRKKNMKLHDAFVTTSYYGLLCHSDNYKFNKRFGYDKLEKSARKIISDSMSI